MKIKHHFQIWKQFWKINLIKTLSFRVNFIMGVIEEIVFYGTQLLTIEVLFNNVKSIGGWNRDEFIFFWAFSVMAMDLFYTFVVGNLWRFSEDDLKRGQLDFKLLKPASEIMSVFFNYISAGSFLILWFPIGILIYAAWNVGLNLLSWLLLPLVVIFAGGFVSALLILMTTFSFWTTQGHGLNYIRYQISQFVFWPEFVFQSKVRFILLYIIPILLVASGPVRFLLNFKDYHLFLGMIIIFIVMIYLIRFLWNLGLKQYSSASS